jgi:hypothetical protein
MDFNGLQFGDILVINGNPYLVVHMQAGRSEIKAILKCLIDISITFQLNSKDYKELVKVKSLYYLGNCEENQALKLLYC